jgi:hypothetical protein
MRLDAWSSILWAARSPGRGGSLLSWLHTIICDLLLRLLGIIDSLLASLATWGTGPQRPPASLHFGLLALAAVLAHFLIAIALILGYNAMRSKGQKGGRVKGDKKSSARKPNRTVSAKKRKSKPSKTKKAKKTSPASGKGEDVEFVIHGDIHQEKRSGEDLHLHIEGDIQGDELVLNATADDKDGRGEVEVDAEIKQGADKVGDCLSSSPAPPPPTQDADKMDLDVRKTDSDRGKVDLKAGKGGSGLDTSTSDSE